MARAVCVLLDIAIVGLLLVILLVLVTGGGTFDVATTHLRLRSVDNPIWELTACIALRFALRRQSPFLGLPRFDLSQIDRRSLAAAGSALRRLGATAAQRWILATCIAALVVKVTAAWWSNWTIVVLAIVGSWHSRILLTWTWLPLAVLSCLPHKESRYVIPIIPFVAIAAAAGIRRVVQAASAPDASGWTAVAGGFLAPLVLLASFQDAGGWRLARSNEEVRLARFLNARGRDGLAVEQSWRLGGGPYLSAHEPVVAIDAARLRDAVSRHNAFKDVKWIALREGTARRLDVLEMRSLGFERDLAWEGQGYWLFTRNAR